VNRFIKGYKTIKGKELIPINIVIMLNCKIIIKLKDNNINKKITASIFDIFSDAMGRLTVLDIFLSILTSIKSLIIQPALLIKNAPIKKSKYHLIILIEYLSTKVSANQQGHTSNIKPIGFEKRMSFKKYLSFKGKILSNIAQ